MKASPLAAIVLAAAMATPSFIHAAGSRDDAVANLASKETEARLLQAELARWNKIKADATARLGPLKERYWQRFREANEQKLPDSPVRTAWEVFMQMERELTQLETIIHLADEQAAAITTRLTQLAGEIADARTARQNFNSRPNEPPGGVKVSSSDYVPGTQPGEQPGLTTSLPGWAAPTPGRTTSSGGSFTTTTPMPPALMPPGSSWQGQTPMQWPPSIFTGPMNPWGPYLNPTPPATGPRCPPTGHKH